MKTRTTFREEICTLPLGPSLRAARGPSRDTSSAVTQAHLTPQSAKTPASQHSPWPHSQCPRSESTQEPRKTGTGKQTTHSRAALGCETQRVLPEGHTVKAHTDRAAQPHPHRRAELTSQEQHGAHGTAPTAGEEEELPALCSTARGTH